MEKIVLNLVFGSGFVFAIDPSTNNDRDPMAPIDQTLVTIIVFGIILILVIAISIAIYYRVISSQGNTTNMTTSNTGNSKNQQRIATDSTISPMPTLATASEIIRKAVATESKNPGSMNSSTSTSFQATAKASELVASPIKVNFGVDSQDSVSFKSNRVYKEAISSMSNLLGKVMMGNESPIERKTTRNSSNAKSPVNNIQETLSSTMNVSQGIEECVIEPGIIFSLSRWLH